MMLVRRPLYPAYLHMYLRQAETQVSEASTEEEGEFSILEARGFSSHKRKLILCQEVEFRPVGLSENIITGLVSEDI